MLKCSKCAVLKDSEEFSTNPSAKTGRDGYCRLCRYQVNAQWKQLNPDKLKQSNRAYRLRNLTRIREQVRILVAKWQRTNRGARNAITAKRRAGRIKATPVWLTKSDLIEIQWAYRIAHDLTLKTGVLYEVDHIIPLQGKNISGLHCPQNLRVITRHENRLKGNSYV